VKSTLKQQRFQSLLETNETVHWCRSYSINFLTTRHVQQAMYITINRQQCVPQQQELHGCLYAEEMQAISILQMTPVGKQVLYNNATK